MSQVQRGAVRGAGPQRGEPAVAAGRADRGDEVGLVRDQHRQRGIVASREPERPAAAQQRPGCEGAAAGDARQVQKAVSQIQGSKSLKGAQEATADMKKKGYDIGELGR
jgi:hypothetical protein